MTEERKPHPDREVFDLKPCPFCGCSRVTVERDCPPSDRPAMDREWVECTRCGAMGPFHRVSRTHTSVIKAWNGRVEG